MRFIVFITTIIVDPSWCLLRDRMFYDGVFSCLMADVEGREEHV